MEDKRLKNIVVLRNLPSNLVEEAIVVLKENKVKTSRRLKKIKTESENKSTFESDYIVKEAELVISNYLSKIEPNKKIGVKKNKLERRYKALKILSLILAMLLAIVIVFIK